ncbi:MAG TPA: CBS domain-containing protein [Candidatus Nanoarchaeia archaeon]|nr:CBS domain-containing protein [Candidatus Nanoarchaeia archaeon]
MDISPIIKSNFLVFDVKDNLSSMIGKLKENNQRFGLVFKNDSYYGLVNRTKLLKAKLDSSKTALEKYVQKTPVINEHASIIETAYKLFLSNLDSIPVEHNKQLIGTIDGRDLASLAVLLPEMQKFKVSDLKILKTAKLSQNDPLAKALEIMHNEHAEQLPIIMDGKLYGVISYRDILKKYLISVPNRDHSRKINKAQGTKSAEVDNPKLSLLPVSSFSSNDQLVTTNKNEPLKDLMKKLQAGDVTCAVVIENGKPLGLVTVKNILRAVSSLNIPVNFNIKYVGLSKLAIDDYDKRSIKKIASNEAFKLQREFQNEAFSLAVHIKEYSKTGTQHKYSVHLHIESPGQYFRVDQNDWDIRRAFHKAFANAQNVVSKRIKN